MADQDKQTTTSRRISEDQRFRYIGFEVYPGKPKDLFRSDAEKAQLVDEVIKKRSRGQILREQCTLLIDRVSSAERIVLLVASIAVLLSLLLPWYSAYKETAVTSTTTAVQQTPVADTTASSGGRHEEVISGAVQHKKVQRTTSTLSGIGGLLAIGSAGGYLFSGGFALILTGVIMLLFTLSAIVLPIYMLITIFKHKAVDDQFALRLKRLLRLNWIPVGLFGLALFLSFMGGDYGSGAVGTYTSIGQSYGPGVFLGTLSYGILIALGGFLLMAAKGIEI